MVVCIVLFISFVNDNRGTLHQYFYWFIVILYVCTLVYYTCNMSCELYGNTSMRTLLEVYIYQTLNIKNSIFKQHLYTSGLPLISQR